MTTTRAAIEQAIQKLLHQDDETWHLGEAGNANLVRYYDSNVTGIGKLHWDSDREYIVSVQPKNIIAIFAAHDAEKKALEDELVRVREALEQVAALDYTCAATNMAAYDAVHIARAALSPTTTKD